MDCTFSVLNVFYFGSIGSVDRKVGGTLHDIRTSSIWKWRFTWALPDSGAERNIMDASLVYEHGYEVHTQPENRIWLQFADASAQRTIGQVVLFWQFLDSHFRVPIVFDVLDNACAEVILSDDFLHEHRVFEDHERAFFDLPPVDEHDYLAPFDVLKDWQWKGGLWKQYFRKDPKRIPQKQNTAVHQKLLDLEAKEAQRKAAWNRQHEFGATADAAERVAENLRSIRAADSIELCSQSLMPPRYRNGLPRASSC